MLIMYQLIGESREHQLRLRGQRVSLQEQHRLNDHVEVASAFNNSIKQAKAIRLSKYRYSSQESTKTYIQRVKNAQKVLWMWQFKNRRMKKLNQAKHPKITNKLGYSQNFNSKLKRNSEDVEIRTKNRLQATMLAT